MPLTTRTPTTEPSVTREDYVLGVILSNGFRMKADGWCYPQGGEPLVRVAVADGHYTMERRRTPETAWMRIVTATVHEFDQEGFESWQLSWQLTA